MPKESNPIHFLSDDLAAMAPHQEELARKRALLGKVQTLRDAMMLNRGKVEGDPTKEYIWVNIREDRQVFFRSMEYNVCRDPNLKINDQYKRDDGTYIRGDLILYEVDKEWYQAMNDYNALRGLQMIEGTTESFMIDAAKVGVPAFIPKH